jgi:hypothetical protein
VNEKRTWRLMRLMRRRRQAASQIVFGSSAVPVYQKPHTSKPAKGHKT